MTVIWGCYTWWYKRSLKNLSICFHYREIQKRQVWRFLADRLLGRDLLYSFFFSSARVQLGSILGYLARMKIPVFSMRPGTDTSWFPASPCLLFWTIFREWPYPPCFIYLQSEGLWLLTHTQSIPFPRAPPP